MESLVVFNPTEELAVDATAGETGRAVETLSTARGKWGHHDVTDRAVMDAVSHLDDLSQ